MPNIIVTIENNSNRKKKIIDSVVVLKKSVAIITITIKIFIRVNGIKYVRIHDSQNAESYMPKILIN